MLAKRVNQRFDVLGIIVFLVFAALISRLGYLQVVQGQYYGNLADGNRIRLSPIMAPRGIFYDRNGVAMVSNRPGFTVSIVATGSPLPEEVIRKLAVLLGMNETDIQAKIKQHNGPFDPIRIKSDIGPDVVTSIEERRRELPGVIIEIQPIRNYVNNDLASHVFGYVSEINDIELEKKKAQGYKQGNIIGKFGLERVYDKELRGTDGGGQMEVDVTGRPVQELGKRNLFLAAI